MKLSLRNFIYSIYFCKINNKKLKTPITCFENQIIYVIL
jgi:hypothetical protein